MMSGEVVPGSRPPPKTAEDTLAAAVGEYINPAVYNHDCRNYVQTPSFTVVKNAVEDRRVLPGSLGKWIAKAVWK